MFTFLLVVHALIAAILVAVILMQRSEGGGLGMGGSPSGLMSARGAADFLTRATTILASLFVILSIALAVIATRRTSPSTIDTSLARTAPLPSSVPMQGDPLAAAAGNVAAPAPAPVTSTTPAPRSVPTRTPKPAAKPAREIAPPPVVATVPAKPAPSTATTPAPAPTPAAPPPGNSN